MSKFLLPIAFIFLGISHSFSQSSFTIFNQETFYDTYAKKSDAPTGKDVFRLRNDLITKKITPEILTAIGETLHMTVSIEAACDNYDRLDSVNLALVPKGDTIYDHNKVQKIELGRFITPFMNKNKMPNKVNYEYNLNNIAAILKDSKLQSKYDFWLELEVTGVPYAAQKQVKGCEGRIDTFLGSVVIVTNGNIKVESKKNTFLLLLNHKENLNNYKEGASDEIGKTIRTISFDVPKKVKNAKLYLITSNHGANDNGEEYIRRMHYVTFDGKSVFTYKPGEESCELYRERNTQGNGIYEKTPKTPEEWQSFSNWCPGAKIPTRIIDLGTIKSGKHSVVISVPDAVFAEKQGDIPVSLYLQGETNKYKMFNF